MLRAWFDMLLAILILLTMRRGPAGGAGAAGDVSGSSNSSGTVVHGCVVLACGEVAASIIHQVEFKVTDIVASAREGHLSSAVAGGVALCSTFPPLVRSKWPPHVMCLPHLVHLANPIKFRKVGADPAPPPCGGDPLPAAIPPSHPPTPTHLVLAWACAPTPCICPAVQPELEKVVTFWVAALAIAMTQAANLAPAAVEAVFLLVWQGPRPLAALWEVLCARHQRGRLAALGRYQPWRRAEPVRRDARGGAAISSAAAAAGGGGHKRSRPSPVQPPPTPQRG